MVYKPTYNWGAPSCRFPVYFPLKPWSLNRQKRRQITERAKFSTKAVVIGGGLLGLEAAKVGPTPWNMLCFDGDN